MLIAILSLLASSAAAAVCIVTEAFHEYTWLWLLPACYAGSFLVLLGLAALFLVVACACVDKEKQREKDSPFFRRMTLLYIDAILTVLPVRLVTKGLEQTPKEGRFLLVCNHLDEIDPAILLHCFPKSQLAFISKQENTTKPLVGKLMPMLLCQLMNRENDREALKTILRCIQILREDKASIAVFPEGYIHQQRKFQNFRPGVFKIAQKVKVPIVVCTLKDTHKAMPLVKKLKKATVTLSLLEVIPAEEVLSRTTVELAQQIHDRMAADLGPEYALEENT